MLAVCVRSGDGDAVWCVFVLAFSLVGLIQCDRFKCLRLCSVRLWGCIVDC